MKPKSLAILLVSLASCGPEQPAKPPIPTLPPASASPPIAQESTPKAHVPRTGFPAAAKKPSVQDYFGTKVGDDYQWLEDGKNADTLAFVAAQNAQSKTYFDA